MKSPLTQKQQYWLDHSQAVEKSELSLVEYAKQHQLNVNAFYNGRNILRKKGFLDDVKVQPSPFVKMIPISAYQKPSTIDMRTVEVTLPNGIHVKAPSEATDMISLIQGLMPL